MTTMKHWKTNNYYKDYVQNCWGKKRDTISLIKYKRRKSITVTDYYWHLPIMMINKQQINVKSNNFQAQPRGESKA